MKKLLTWTFMGLCPTLAIALSTNEVVDGVVLSGGTFYPAYSVAGLVYNNETNS